MYIYHRYNVNKLFRLIETIAENQEPLEITKDLVEIAIKTEKVQMKKMDESNYIRRSRNGLNSTTYIFREISLAQQIPNQWKTMRIKSIH